MKRNNNVDAYGRELWALYKGTTDEEIVERDDRYVASGGYGKTYLAAFKDWPPTDKKAMHYAKGRVLDIGCGAGRHALYLQKKGHSVMAIDNSPLAVKITKLRGVRNAKVLPIEKINIFKKNYFDTILMMGNNFGLFANARKAKRLLKILNTITLKDAVIIAQTNDPYKTKDKDHLAYHAFNRKRGRMSGQVRIRIRYGKLIGPWFDYLMVSREEMKRILKGTGWKVKKFLSTQEAQYVAILKKA